MSETPRTDEHLRMKAENGQVAVVNREFARQLERENNKLRILLDKTSRALSCFIVDAIKDGLGEGEGD